MIEEKITTLADRNSGADRVLALQKGAYLADPCPSLESRKSSLKALENLLLDNQDAIIEAINQDFGNRATTETKLLELFPTVDGIRDICKHLKKWMKPQRRHVSYIFAGGRNQVTPQPKGVVGIIVPWNYPVFLTAGPLASVLAAGNRAMIKMSENSPQLNKLMARLFRETFDEADVAIIESIEGSQFSSLPFDHLVFTGSPATGKKVMAAAADNLTPVTLELGGKSPAIIGEDYDIETAAKRIAHAKCLNSGQTCVAPDYVFVPRAKQAAFVDAIKASTAKMYADVATSDFTSIIDQPAFNRLQLTLQDAIDKGATATQVMTGERDTEKRKQPLMVVTDVSDDMILMQDEIFGPILPLIPYDNIEQVIDYIGQRERPLALYLYSNDRQLQDKTIQQTISGGVTLNDCCFHAIQHDLPFGGIGNSGMGHYHGYEGFLEFSKLRPVFKQAPISSVALLAPPYGRKIHGLIDFLLK